MCKESLIWKNVISSPLCKITVISSQNWENKCLNQKIKTHWNIFSHHLRHALKIMELPPISRRVKENMPQKLFTFMIVIDLRVNYGLNVFFSKIYDIQYLKKKKKRLLFESTSNLTKYKGKKCNRSSKKFFV